MDRFAHRMTARGPTLGTDRETWTGSLHIVDLPSADAARKFVEREPYNRAGMFERHAIHRFENLLGRTMWEFRGGAADPRFLVIAHLRAAASEHAGRADLTALPREDIIVHGELLAPDHATPAGLVVALQAPRRDAVEAIGEATLDEHYDIEILDWEFGGRR